MIDRVKYSIIIPHFNDEVGLKRLLSSIPNRDDLEVLVIDDKSSSDLFSFVVSECGIRNVSAFVNNRVKSAGSCRNIGLENASGEYLLFADSDDFFTSDAFDIIDSSVSKNPTADVVFFNVTSLNDKGFQGLRHVKNRQLVLNFIRKKGRYYEEKLRFTHNVPWGKAIKKSLISSKSIFFDETIIANDGVFSLKVGRYADRIVAVPDVAYCVTQSRRSLTQSKDIEKFRVRLEVYLRYYYLLSESEREKVGASPLPLIYRSKVYGVREVVRSLLFFKKNNVHIFKYFKMNKSKLIGLLK